MAIKSTMAKGSRYVAQTALRKLPKLDTDNEPVKAGEVYYWDAWNVDVRVRRVGSQLYVTPPRGVRVRVTAALAGQLVRMGKHAVAHDERGSAQA